MSIMGMRHRSKDFEAVTSQAEAPFNRLLGIDPGCRVLFVQGGASTQFAMLPMNFLPPGGSADYVQVGSWSEKAIEEGNLFGKANICASTKADGYKRMPRPDELKRTPGAAYLHLTSNETIQG